MSKPEPIILGVSGIAPKPITMNEPLPNLHEICTLPPFQMFVREHGQRNENALRAAHDYLAQSEPSEVWADYCTWFAEKQATRGYWQNENPDGSLKT